MKLLDIRDINETHLPITLDAPSRTNLTEIAEPKPHTFEQRADRVAADAETAKAAGFKLEATLFEAGTAVNELGVENAKKSREAFEKLPLLTNGLTDFEKTIAAEKRNHLVVKPSDLKVKIRPQDDTFDVHLGLKTVSNTAFLTLHSANQLADIIEMPRKVMSWLYENGGLEAEALLQRELNESEAKSVKVRGRASPNGGREVFAIVSEKYPIVDAAPTVSQKVLSALSELPGARIDIQYNPKTLVTIFDVQFHSNIEAGNYACGELFRAGVRITCNDRGDGSVTVQAFVIRNLCLNLIVLHTATLDIDKIIHAGSVEGRVKRIEEALLKSQGVVGGFAQKWADAAEPVKLQTLDIKIDRRKIKDETKIKTKTWEESTEEERVAGVIRGSSSIGILPPMSEDTIQTVASAYWRDTMVGVGEPYSYQKFANAISRAAHEDFDRDLGTKLEETAGLLTWNRPQLAFQSVAVLG